MKNFQLRTLSLFAIISIIFFSVSCKKTSTTTTSAVIPTVITQDVLVNVTTTTAQSGGIVTSNGDATITANGVCYSTTNQTPTTADSKTKDSVSKAGTVITYFNSNLTGLTANTVYYVRAYAVNSAGIGYGAVLKFTTSSSLNSLVATVSTFAGSTSAGYLDGSGLGAQFNNPQGVGVDKSGNIYVGDTFNSLIRKITSSAVVSTFAGNGTIGLLNGPALSSQFYASQGVVADAQGNVYVADVGNNVIRKISTTGVVSTYAGTGIAGYINGAADSTHLASATDSLAQFNNPCALAIDATGNIYVADRGNHTIRKILTTGRVKTIAGYRTIPGFVNGTGDLAFFRSPSGVAVDASGNVFVADQGNAAIRKITPAQVVTTVAGGPSQANLFVAPSAITIDAAGDLFIADESGRVMEYNTEKVIYTLAGKLNTYGYTDGSGLNAKFNSPQGIAVDASGNIYVADRYNNVIRKITVALVNN